jgi:glycosyltransferase involved in cell wall biosynthesis
MRILTITNYYPPHFIGGYEIACKETMDFLKEQGHNILVISSNYQKSHKREEQIQRNMRITNYNTSSKIHKKLDEHHNYTVLKEAIQSFKPDLVYYWSLRGIGLKALKASDEENIPKVFEIGDFWMQGYMQKGSKLKESIRKTLPFLTKKKIDFSPAICVSKWIEEEMRTRYKTKQTYVIPNATHIPLAIKKNNQKIKFIFVGRMEEEKGIEIAIESLNQFTKKYPEQDFTFNVYGGGDAQYVQKCKGLAEPLGSKISFKGQVKNRKEMYKNASILLMPTQMREPFGLVIIEAMAYRCAVIATNAYGPAEIVDHRENGLLFNIHKPNDLLKKIEELYFNHLLLDSLQENAYQYVLKNYSIQKVKHKVEILIKRIAGVVA